MGLVTLTPAQFKAKRPKGDYAAYHRYVTNARARRGAARAADPLTSLVNTYQGYMQTPAQLRKSSAQAVSDSINDKASELEALYKSQNDRIDVQRQRAEGFSTALGALTKNNPQALADEYRTAADRFNAYGSGLTGAVADAQKQSAADTRSRITEFLGTPSLAHGYDADAIHNAAQMAGVTIPGQSLEASAVEAYQNALYDRDARVQGVGQIARDYAQKQTDLLQGLTDSRMQTANSRPRLIREEYASELKQQRDNAATLFAALGLINTTNRTNVQNAATTATTKATTQGKAGKGSAAGYWLNPVTGVREKIGEGNTIVMLNGVRTKVKVGTTVKKLANGKEVLVLPGKAGAKKPGATTPSQVRLAISTGVSQISKVIGDKPYAVVTNPNAVEYAGQKPKYKPLLAYPAAKTRLLTYFPKALRSNSQVLQAVNDILAKYGYKVP